MWSLSLLQVNVVLPTPAEEQRRVREWQMNLGVSSHSILPEDITRTAVSAPTARTVSSPANGRGTIGIGEPVSNPSPGEHEMFEPDLEKGCVNSG